MKPITFWEANVVFVKDEPEYLPLPAFRDENAKGGPIIFCQSLSFKERLKLLFTGKLWVALLMFGEPLTPSFFTVNKEDVITNAKE